MDCLFCKIVKKKEKTDIVHEDKNFIVIKDIAPKAPVHLLLVPKKHIPSVDELKKEDKKLMGEAFLLAKKLASEKELKGYKLVINVGKEAGQTIDHLHIHLLSGKGIKMP